MKLSIIFPIYNERPTVSKVLDQLLAFHMDGVDKEIIIVEGASSDGTREIVRQYHGLPEVIVIYEGHPQGKGAAVRKGLGKVTGDVVLIQDGDLEYSIGDYPKLLSPFLNGAADIVFGSRALEPRQRWQYRQYQGWDRLYGFLVNLGGAFYTWLFNRLYGTQLSDGATMFKVFRAKLLKGIAIRSSGFDFDWEIQAKLAKRGYQFLEIPVWYKARSKAEGKKIRFWRDGRKVLWAILKYRFMD